MRFASNKTVNAYTDKAMYNYSHTWFRLNNKNMTALDAYISPIKDVYICDRKGVGCVGCGQCAKFTTGSHGDLFALNLSESGLCPFDCVDCYAKKMQNFLVGCEKAPIIYDVIKQNLKQKGKTKHILLKKKELKAA